MSQVKQLLKSPHIQIAITTGICIIIMAYFSKRILLVPIDYLPSAIPPFLMVIYEIVLVRFRERKIAKVIYWIISIIFITFLVIFLTWVRII